MDSHTHYSITMKLPWCIQINLHKSQETKTNTLQLLRTVWCEKMIKQMRGSNWKMQMQNANWFFKVVLVYAMTFLSIRIWMHGDIDNVSWTLSSNSIKLSNCAWANCERLRWRFPLHYCVELFTRFAYYVVPQLIPVGRVLYFDPSGGLCLCGSPRLGVIRSKGCGQLNPAVCYRHCGSSPNQQSLEHTARNQGTDVDTLLPCKWLQGVLT